MSQTNLQLASVIDDGLLLDAKLGTDDLVALYVQTKITQINEEIEKIQGSFPAEISATSTEKIEEVFLKKVVSAIKRKFSKDKSIKIDEDCLSGAGDGLDYSFDRDGKLWIHQISLVIETTDEIKAHYKTLKENRETIGRLQSRIYNLTQQKNNTNALMQEGRAIIAQYKLQKAGHSELLKKIEATT